MADMWTARRAKCGDTLITKEVSGRVTLVSAYPDENVYLRTGLEVLFDRYPYHKEKGMVVKTVSQRKAVLHRVLVERGGARQVEDVLLFKGNMQVALNDLVINQEMLVTDLIKLPRPKDEPLDVRHQLFKDGIVRT